MKQHDLIISLENSESEYLNLKKLENEEEITHFLIKNNKNISMKDEYLKEIFLRMNFTKFHFYMILSIILIKTCEGSEISALSISSQIIENHFKLEAGSSSLINVIILSGYFLGYLGTICIHNKFGRKFFIKIGVVLIIVFSFLSICSHKIQQYVVSRFIVNMGIGFIIPSTVALVIESVNSNYKQFITNLILISGYLGEVIIALSLRTVINKHEMNKLFIFAISPVVF